MELVDRRTNVLRGTAPAAVHAKKTHCKRGHAFDASNTEVRMQKNGHPRRDCLACRRERVSR
jgi:hypothetical protein